MKTAELAKLAWQCRRGTAELERLLRYYLEYNYQQSSKPEQQLFQQLLSFEDNLLIAYLLSEQLPTDKELAALVEKIRTATIIPD